jgi:hypothetical protein
MHAYPVILRASYGNWTGFSSSFSGLSSIYRMTNFEKVARNQDDIPTPNTHDRLMAGLMRERSGRHFGVAAAAPQY